MSLYGRVCCKSRKSNNPENPAKVDVWTSLLLRRFSALLRSSVIRFWMRRYGPSRRRAEDASAALRIFVRYPKKYFCNKIGQHRAHAPQQIGWLFDLDRAAAN